MGSAFLTITGKNLPLTLEDGLVTLTFTGGSQCLVKNTTSTSIICLTDAFATSITQATVTINLNGLTDTSL